jgi:hypothetical protein
MAAELSESIFKRRDAVSGNFEPCGQIATKITIIA